MKAFERLQSQLVKKGIFVLEVGELEGFVRTVGGHGPRWVNEVLNKDLKNDPELETARQFIQTTVTAKPDDKANVEEGNALVRALTNIPHDGRSRSPSSA